MAIKSESKLWDSLARFFRRHAVHRTPATARVSAFVYPDATLDEAALRHICACVTIFLFTSFSRINNAPVSQATLGHLRFERATTQATRPLRHAHLPAATAAAGASVDACSGHFTDVRATAEG